MKTILQNSFLLLLVLGFGLMSCGKGKKGQDASLEAHIPDDALIVGRLRSVPSLIEQAGPDALLKALEQEGNKSETLKALLKDPSTLGLDPKAYMMFFMPAKSEAPIILLSVADSKAFAAKIEAASKENNESFDKEALSDGIELGKMKGDAALAWNESMAIFGPELGKLAKEDIAAYFKKSEKSISNDAQYQKSMKANHDFSMHLNLKGIIAANGKNSVASAEAVGIKQADIEACQVAFFTDFTNGNASYGLEYDLSAPVKDFLSKAVSEGINKSLNNYLHPDKTAVAFGLSINFEGIKTTLAGMGFEAIANGALSQYGLQLDDIVSGLSGDLLVGVSGIDQDGIPEPVIALGLKSADFGPKLLDIAEKQLKLQGLGEMADFKKDGNTLSIVPKMDMGVQGYAIANKDALVFCLSKESFETAKSGGGKGYAPTSKLLSNAMFLYFNYGNMLALMEKVPGNVGSSDIQSFQVFAKTMENNTFHMNMREFVGKSEFKDKKANALASFLQIGQELSALDPIYDNNNLFDDEDDEESFY